MVRQSTESRFFIGRTTYFAFAAVLAALLAGCVTNGKFEEYQAEADRQRDEIKGRLDRAEKEQSNHTKSLAKLEESLTQLNQSIQGLQSSLQAQTANVEKSAAQRMDALDARLSDAKSKIDSADFKNYEQMAQEMKKDYAQVPKDIVRINDQISDIISKLSSMENTIVQNKQEMIAADKQINESIVENSRKISKDFTDQRLTFKSDLDSSREELLKTRDVLSKAASSQREAVQNLLKELEAIELNIRSMVMSTQRQLQSSGSSAEPAAAPPANQ